MATLGDLIGAKLKQDFAGKPKLQTCPKCGKEYFIYHMPNECQSQKDKPKEKDKNGKRK